MKDICVIVGGSSGMGLAAAKEIAKSGKHIIIIGRTISKLEDAINELKGLGISAEAHAGDVSSLKSMQDAAAYVSAQGNIRAVVLCAGISPEMGTYDQILDIDAIGTIHVDTAFAPYMGEGSCILNVSSMAAYQVPMKVMDFYPLAFTDIPAFRDGLMKACEQMPEGIRSGMAYVFSKQFVIWFSKRRAVKYGRQGIRVVSISPGHFRTPMEKYQGEEGVGTQMAREGALGRVGDPSEIARMMAFMVSPEASYLCGTDILYDGGTIAAIEAKSEDQRFARAAAKAQATNTISGQN